MCGIGGIVMLSKDRTARQLGYVRNLVKFIAIENQLRGKDATGFAVFNNYNTWLFKQPMKATELVDTNTYDRFINESVNNSTLNILIHTRAGTKGSELNNDNNHPIETKNIVGVHNGVIYNDDELFKSESLFRQAQVDSEVIFRLHDKYGAATTREIKMATEKLSGFYTYSFVDKEKRNLLHLVKNNNPVTLVFIPDLNIIAFASEKIFLENAIAICNDIDDCAYIFKEECEWVTPSAETIMVFDALIADGSSQINQVGAKFRESLDHYYSGWSNNYNETYYFEDEYSESVKDSSDIESIIGSLSADKAVALSQYILMENEKVWNKAWSQGRASLDQELNQVKGIYYEKGLKDGANRAEKFNNV